MKRIKYRSGMLEIGFKPRDLAIKIWNGIQIPLEVRKVVIDEDLENLAGVLGDRKASDSVEYDHLTLAYRGGKTVEIKVYNRGNALFLTDDDRIKRIHRILCKLNKGETEAQDERSL